MTYTNATIKVMQLDDSGNFNGWVDISSHVKSIILDRGAIRERMDVCTCDDAPLSQQELKLRMSNEIKA